MTDGSIMATIITVHMTRNGSRPIPWQVGMSAFDAVQAQASAATTTRLPATGVAASRTGTRARIPCALLHPFLRPRQPGTHGSGCWKKNEGPGGCRGPRHRDERRMGYGTLGQLLQFGVFVHWAAQVGSMLGSQQVQPVPHCTERQSESWSQACVTHLRAIADPGQPTAITHFCVRAQSVSTEQVTPSSHPATMPPYPYSVPFVQQLVPAPPQAPPGSGVESQSE